MQHASTSLCPPPRAYRVRVWDLPTRIFHWALALCFFALLGTGYAGGNAMPWHFRLGYVMLALLLFRLVWGLVGGRWSRFASFLYSPASVVAYLRKRSHPDHLVGHTPLGAGAVFALLLLLAVQVSTGLFSDDGVAFAGPLTRFASGETVRWLGWYHEHVGQWLLIVLVALHLAAILFYLLVKKENLVRPMLAGDKSMAQPAASSRDDVCSRLAAAVLLALAAGVAWLVQLGG